MQLSQKSISVVTVSVAIHVVLTGRFGVARYGPIQRGAV